MQSLNIIYFLLGILFHYLILMIPKKLKLDKIKKYDSIQTFRFDNEFDFPMKYDIDQQVIIESVILSALQCSEKSLDPLIVKKGNYRVKFFLGANFVKKTEDK